MSIAPVRKTGARAKVVVALVGLLVLAGLVTLFLWQEGILAPTRGVASRPWVVVTPAGPRFLLLTKMELRRYVDFGRVGAERP